MGTAEKLDYCRALAASGLLPAQYRQQPANLLYAVEFADSLGLHPMVAITGVHVIEGRPSASSALISALVRRAGHKLRVKGDASRAVAQIVRADDPSFTFEVAFALDDAERAGLLKKAVWKNYPASMLKARAISAVARDACEEALFGIHYTPEELGAEVDADGEPIEARFERQAPRAEDQWQQAAPAAQQTPPETVAAGVAPAPQESLTPGGRDYLHEAMAAPDAATVRLIWADARAEGARDGYLAQITEVGKGKAAAEAKRQQPSDAELYAALGSPHDDVVAAADAEMQRQTDAARRPEPETLPGAPDDRKAVGLATADMLAAGAAVGVSAPEVWQMFLNRHGHGSDSATVAELRAIEAELREVAR
jgi:hypothetical protein